MEDATKLCPSCAGQITTGAISCPWCGAGFTGGDVTRVATAPPPAAASPGARGIGLGNSRPLPQQLPLPPENRPVVQLNPTQVFLRTVIVVGSLYLLFLVGRKIILFSACAIPQSPLCP